ncbi:glucosylglycerol hydrolase [Haloarcula regularis]|uniref:glucosylglycerol hydrolase n=1 Tax=Haloarcula regularis TaxID=3033392 RepID=UPI0023E8AA2E|nr:glucosylglycerol hydrolase [Halomicroarcula sp. SYNS111]
MGSPGSPTTTPSAAAPSSNRTRPSASPRSTATWARPATNNCGRRTTTPPPRCCSTGLCPAVRWTSRTRTCAAPWGFVRDTDAVWNLKVLSEEANFPEWQVRPQDFASDEHFGRLKEWGFESREELSEFLGLLADVVSMTDYDKAEMVDLLNAAGTPVGDEFTVGELEQLGRDWMRDMGEFFNLAHWHDQQGDERTAFDLAVREFRHDHEWVTTGLTGDDELDYVYPTDGTVLYYGFRRAPDESEEILFVATMEGVAEEVVPTDLVDVDDAGWEIALSSPDLDVAAADEPVELADSQSTLFVRSLD